MRKAVQTRCSFDHINTAGYTSALPCPTLLKSPPSSASSNRHPSAPSTISIAPISTTASLILCTRPFTLSPPLQRPQLPRKAAIRASQAPHILHAQRADLGEAHAVGEHAVDPLDGVFHQECGEGRDEGGVAVVEVR